MMILVGGVIVGTHMFMKEIELSVYVGMIAMLIIEFGLGYRNKGVYSEAERDAILTMMYRNMVGLDVETGDKKVKG